MADNSEEKAKTLPPPRKKKGAPAAHHGGAWKVAFADFMTSMFALFLVLWVIATSSASQRAAIASYFRNPTLFEPGSNKPIVMEPTTEGGGEQEQDGSSKNADASMIDRTGEADKQAISNLQKEMKSDSILKELGSQFKLEQTSQGLKIELNEAGATGVFELGSARLTPAMRRQLTHITKLLASTGNKIVVAGYTDKFQYSSGYSNSQLSADRANAVREQLIAAGMDTARLEAVVGYGDHSLANPSNPYSAENRRVSIMILQSGRNFGD